MRTCALHCCVRVSSEREFHAELLDALLSVRHHTLWTAFWRVVHYSVLDCILVQLQQVESSPEMLVLQCF